jgi:hypothetical protein
VQTVFMALDSLFGLGLSRTDGLRMFVLLLCYGGLR